MEEAEEEIYLRSQALTNEIQAYNPDDIDETDVLEKIFLAEEVLPLQHGCVDGKDAPPQ